MAIPQTLLTRFMGWTVQGDLGPWTFYTSRRRQIVFYAKAPPLSPASIDQTHFRNLFRTAARAWHAQQKPTRNNWTQAAKKAGLRITGYNLWTYYQVTRDRKTIQTVERATNIQLVSS